MSGSPTTNPEGIDIGMSLSWAENNAPPRIQANSEAVMFAKAAHEAGQMLALRTHLEAALRADELRKQRGWGETIQLEHLRAHLRLIVRRLTSRATS